MADWTLRLDSKEIVSPAARVLRVGTGKQAVGGDREAKRGCGDTAHAERALGRAADDTMGRLWME